MLSEFTACNLLKGRQSFPTHLLRSLLQPGDREGQQLQCHGEWEDLQAAGTRPRGRAWMRGDPGAVSQGLSSGELASGAADVKST